jgi:hypothetical protein
MGYHITLLRSPPRPVTWDELRNAATGLGWTAHEPEREVRLGEGENLEARVILGEDGEPWAKLTGDAELRHLIVLAGALGARARGDDFESYRTPDDWYVHPDDRADHDAARAAETTARARKNRLRPWDIFRMVVLLALVVFFILRIAGVIET